ncbi:MAG: phosphoenolpyruvate--protein phosphotransferase [Candidatus Hydrogenedentes bacterium]|nr:phosphoenolpyruvate--protein phosphotransferase [Candidatus Hydrogenedentota bacterium]
MEKKFQGIPVSPGIAWGRVLIYDTGKLEVPKYRIKSPKEEIERLKEAVHATKEELSSLYKKTLENIGKTHASILEVHLMLLDDQTIFEEVNTRISSEHINSEAILFELSKKYAEELKNADNPINQERTADLIDVIDRIIRNLTQQKRPDLDSIKNPIILLSQDLPPSEASKLKNDKILALALEKGSATSHAAILAKSLKIPTVVGIVNLFDSYLHPIKGAAVDAIEGNIYVNPTSETISKLRYKKNKLKKTFSFYEKRLLSLPSSTVDKVNISVFANIEFPNEVDDNIKHLAAGIGLYRTEYLFLDKVDLPSEDEQYEEYIKVAKKIHPLPVTLRTIDIGGDKLSSYSKIFNEQNPQLGCRAVRFCLSNINFFKTQLRAILRASIVGNVKIMFPMISSVDELRQVKKILEEAKSELDHRNIPYNKNIQVGIMIEVPSAVIIADDLAKECDFFSIGTNDLIQYSLAVDRNNYHIAHLYEPAHPAILRMLKNIIESAEKANIQCSVCGEMASDPLFTEFFIGIGLRNFSMSAVSIPQIRTLITAINYMEAKEFAEKVLRLPTATEAKETLKERLKKYKSVISA